MPISGQASSISASMTGGSFVAKGNGHFVATPSAVGKDVTIHVTARDKGQGIEDEKKFWSLSDSLFRGFGEVTPIIYDRVDIRRNSTMICKTVASDRYHSEISSILFPHPRKSI